MNKSSVKRNLGNSEYELGSSRENKLLSNNEFLQNVNSKIFPA